MVSKVLCYVDILTGKIGTFPDTAIVKVERMFTDNHPYPYVVSYRDGDQVKVLQTKDVVWVVTGAYGGYEPGQVVEAVED